MRANPMLRSHWFGFLFLGPFLLMVLVHRLLGFSDALMVETPPGEREARAYNLLVMIVFYSGVFSFVFHDFVYSPRSPAWRAAKLFTLVIYWVLVLKVL